MAASFCYLQKAFLLIWENPSIENIKNAPPLFISRNRMVLKIISIVAQVWFSEQDKELASQVLHVSWNETNYEEPLNRALWRAYQRRQQLEKQRQHPPPPSSVNHQLPSHCSGPWRQRMTLMLILQLTWFDPLLGFLKSETSLTVWCAIKCRSENISY